MVDDVVGDLVPADLVEGIALGDIASGDLVLMLLSWTVDHPIFPVVSGNICALTLLTAQLLDG